MFLNCNVSLDGTIDGSFQNRKLKKNHQSSNLADLLDLFWWIIAHRPRKIIYCPVFNVPRATLKRLVAKLKTIFHLRRFSLSLCMCEYNISSVRLRKRQCWIVQVEYFSYLFWLVFFFWPINKVNIIHYTPAPLEVLGKIVGAKPKTKNDISRVIN